MNSCTEFQGAIPRLLFGDINDADRQSLEQHLQACQICAAEGQRYRTALEGLELLEDHEVPRHFFIDSAERRLSPWDLFRQLTPAWRVGIAAAVLLLCLAGALAAVRLQVRAENGILALGFGNLERDFQPMEKLRTDMTQLVEAQLANERQAWLQTLRAELTVLGQSLDQSQRDFVQSAFAELEMRVNRRILTSQAALQSGTQASLDQLYQYLREERQQDVLFVTERIDQLAQRQDQRSSQTDAVLTALLDAADQTVRR